MDGWVLCNTGLASWLHKNSVAAIKLLRLKSLTFGGHINLVKNVVLQKSHPLTSTTKQKTSYQKSATSKRTSLILIHQRTTNYCLFQFLCKTKLVQQVQTIISYPISPHFSKVIITYIGNLWKKKPPLHFFSIRPL